MNNPYSEARATLVKKLEGEGVLLTPSILQAFRQVPRELFISPPHRRQAYEDMALPLAPRQTISQPYTIAVMLEFLSPQPGESILEIGSGSGYVLALLSQIVGLQGKVFGVELNPETVEGSEGVLKALKINNVEVKAGDGKEGWPEKAPFDRILVSAACTHLYPAWETQLVPRGTIVAPIGGAAAQHLVKARKTNGTIQEEVCPKGLFVFVPLRS
ncbi:MAG: protein-L-isoaspartate(D-aspartate) O-methyltransferase [Candidatus Diapherotrites archaeon]|nr:protein-L-isoaspartate(D-aspartate) O-methyltransferase [Candidatus Diapherotrites archaeon]MDZ4256698.1 protein-L-isoaspartate(D-aspartate) O-methyltransferase [archaeon]